MVFRARPLELPWHMHAKAFELYLLEINSSPRQAIDSITPVSKDYLRGPAEQICLCEEQDGPHIHRVCEIDKNAKTIACAHRYILIYICICTHTHTQTQ
jgi:hypothetical protein